MGRRAAAQRREHRLCQSALAVARGRSGKPAAAPRAREEGDRSLRSSKLVCNCGGSGGAPATQRAPLRPVMRFNNASLVQATLAEGDFQETSGLPELLPELHEPAHLAWVHRAAGWLCTCRAWPPDVATASCRSQHRSGCSHPDNLEGRRLTVHMSQPVCATVVVPARHWPKGQCSGLAPASLRRLRDSGSSMENDCEC